MAKKSKINSSVILVAMFVFLFILMIFLIILTVKYTVQAKDAKTKYYNQVEITETNNEKLTELQIQYDSK